MKFGMNGYFGCWTFQDNRSFKDNGLVDCIIKTNQKGFKNVGCEGGQGAFV